MLNHRFLLLFRPKTAATEQILSCHSGIETLASSRLRQENRSHCHGDGQLDKYGKGSSDSWCQSEM